MLRPKVCTTALMCSTALIFAGEQLERISSRTLLQKTGNGRKINI